MADKEDDGVAFIKTKNGGVYRATPLLLKRRDITRLSEEQGLAELAKQAGKKPEPAKAKPKAEKPKAEKPEPKPEPAPEPEPEAKSEDATKSDIGDIELPDEIKDIMNG